MPTAPRATASVAGVGLLLILAATVISGVSNFMNFYAVQGTNSDAFVTARNLLTALLLVPFVLIGARSLTPRLRRADLAGLLAVGLLGGAIPFLLFFRGLEIASAAGGAATATFAYRSLFLLATLLGIVFLGERFRWRVSLAAGLLMAGNVLLLSLVYPVWSDGTAYVLAATILWAGEYTLSRRLLRGLPSSTVSLGRMGFGAIFLVGYLAATAQVGALGTLSGSQWTWVLLSGLLLAAFVGVWYAGLQRVEVGVATSVLVLGFPITFALSVLFHGSPFTIGQVAGALVLTAGVGVIVGRAQLREFGRYLRQGASRRPTG